MQRLEAIGTGKQTSRLDALRAIGLIREVGDGLIQAHACGPSRRFLGEAPCFSSSMFVSMAEPCG